LPLNNEQLITAIKAFASAGIDKIRFTGGEPTIRPGLVELMRGCYEIDNILQLGITTNGILLKKLLPDLIKAGLNRLNISLDTLNKEKFRRITGRDKFETVMEGLMEALDSGTFRLLKVNTVVMKGINDDETPRFAEWALENGIDLRFIEFMPTCRSGWGEGRFISEAEIKQRIGLDLLKLPGFDRSHGPAESYFCPGSRGRISFISAVSGCFCNECNRIRLTSGGELIGCLFSNYRISLRPLLEGNSPLEEIVEFIRKAIIQPDFRRLSYMQSITDSQPFMRGIGG
jgi:cyclic pyranopterin phosphate synthase